MPEGSEKVDDMEAQMAGNAITLIKGVLANVSTRLLQGAIDASRRQAIVGPLLDPTAFLSSDRFDELAAQTEAGELLLRLKTVWRQDA